MGLPEQFVLNMLLKGTGREQWWLSLRNSLRKRLEDDFLLRWLTENSPRDPHFFLVDKSPVKNALVLAVAEDFNGVSNVHDDGVWNAFGSDPLAFIEELQTGNHVVEYESECTHVRVSFNTESKFWLWAFWIVVDLHLKQQFFQTTNFLF